MAQVARLVMDQDIGLEQEAGEAVGNVEFVGDTAGVVVAATAPEADDVAAQRLTAATVGRSECGGRRPCGPSVGLLSVVSQPPRAALAEILTHEHVQRVKVIDLPQLGTGPLDG